MRVRRILALGGSLGLQLHTTRGLSNFVVQRRGFGTAARTGQNERGGSSALRRHDISESARPRGRIDGSRLRAEMSTGPGAEAVVGPASSIKSMELTSRIHVWGGMLKTSAVKAQLRFGAAKAPMKPAHLAQCAACYFLFIIYRAYRGFFVIIPAVFNQVKGRLRAGVIEAETELNADVDPQTGRLRKRSAVLISFGAAVVTGVYSIKTVVGGVLNGAASLVWPLRGCAAGVSGDEGSAVVVDSGEREA